MAQPKSTSTKKSPWVLPVMVGLLLIAFLIVKTCQRTKGPVHPAPKEETSDSRGLNRNPSNIIYSKHARCRMSCRHIDESEVKEILKAGKINYAKSELNGTACKKKYAVEGTTHDGQRVRFIFAPCNTELTVVTVIDIGKEWPCDCK